MPLPPAEDVCVELSIDAGLGIDLPSLSIGFLVPGVEFSALLDAAIPQPGDVTAKLLAQVNAALAPIVPLLDIIDVLLTVKAVLDAVLSLSPPKISAKISLLVPKLNKLLRLVPPTSLLVPLKQIVTVLIVFLQSMRLQLLAIIEAQAKIDLGGARAASLGAVHLAASLACAQANLDLQFRALKGQGAPLNRLVGTLNLFSDLAGTPKIPLLVDLGASASVAVAPLDAAIAALVALRAGLPG